MAWLIGKDAAVRNGKQRDKTAENKTGKNPATNGRFEIEANHILNGTRVHIRVARQAVPAAPRAIERRQTGRGVRACVEQVAAVALDEPVLDGVDAVAEARADGARFVACGLRRRGRRGGQDEHELCKAERGRHGGMSGRGGAS